MYRTLQQTSAFLFFVLGISLFAAYLLLKIDFQPFWGAWWLQRADLPFALVTLLYGGTSLYSSLKPKDHGSKTLALVIGIPLAALFIFLVVLNFWEVLPFPQGQSIL